VFRQECHNSSASFLVEITSILPKTSNPKLKDYGNRGEKYFEEREEQTRIKNGMNM
jgi:hypothetical protein